MSTVTQDGQPSAKTGTYVYFFGSGKAEGNGRMKDELGGKGARLAQMAKGGLPVPPGFTIQTEAYREYMRHGNVSKEAALQMEDALARLEELTRQKLGKGENPLLVSVRSGCHDQAGKSHREGLSGPIRHHWDTKPKLSGEAIHHIKYLPNACTGSAS